MQYKAKKKTTRRNKQNRYPLLESIGSNALPEGTSLPHSAADKGNASGTDIGLGGTESLLEALSGGGTLPLGPSDVGTSVVGDWTIWVSSGADEVDEGSGPVLEEGAGGNGVDVAVVVAVVLTVQGWGGGELTLVGVVLLLVGKMVGEVVGDTFKEEFLDHGLGLCKWSSERGVLIHGGGEVGG